MMDSLEHTLEFTLSPVCKWAVPVIRADETWMCVLLHNLDGTQAGFIRIDGSVPMAERQGLVKRFQEDDQCRVSDLPNTQTRRGRVYPCVCVCACLVQVALLSIAATGEDLNLTAAGTIVFAELYWVSTHPSQ